MLQRQAGDVTARGLRSTVCYVDNDLQSAEAAELAEEVTSLRTLTARLRAENARLLRLLELTPKQAAPPGPVQTGFFEARPVRSIGSRLRRRRSTSSARCLPRGLTSTQCDGRTRAPAGLAGCRRCVAGGARAAAREPGVPAADQGGSSRPSDRRRCMSGCIHCWTAICAAGWRWTSTGRRRCWTPWRT